MAARKNKNLEEVIAHGGKKTDTAESVLADGVKASERLEKMLQCMQLRKGGASYPNIARNTGITEATARAYVVDEMTRIKDELQEEAIAHRQMQLERLNEMMLSYWPRRADPKYGAMILTLMNKQDALLGITAEKIDLTVTSNDLAHLSDEALDAMLSKKLGALNAPVPKIRNQE